MIINKKGCGKTIFTTTKNMYNGKYLFNMPSHKCGDERMKLCSECSKNKEGKT